MRSRPIELAVGRPVTRAALAIASIAICAKLLGFVEKQIIAYYFGAGSQADVFFIALSVPTLIFLLVREIIEPAFLPVFMRCLDDGREGHGWQLFGFVGAVTAFVTVAIAGAVWVGGPSVASHLAPGLTAPALQATGDLLRLVIPGAVFLSLSALTYITLNVYRHFALPAAGDLALKVAPSLCCVLLIERLGVAALGVGFLVGAAARLGIHVFGLAPRLRLVAWPVAEARADLRHFGLLVLPLLVGATFAQISELADNFFASMIGEGGIASRTFAKKIRDLPLEIAPYTLSVVLFPYLTHLASTGKRAALQSLFNKSAHGTAIVFAALGVSMWFLAEPIVSVALERGAFGETARRATAWPLQLYALGMVTFAVEALLVNYYFALADTRTPIAVGLLGVALNVGLCALLIEPMGVGGVALALTLSKTAKVVVLIGILPAKGHAIAWSTAIRCAARVAAATGVAMIGLWAFTRASFATLHDMPLAHKAFLLAVGTVVGVGLFLGTLALIGARERGIMAAAGRLLMTAGKRKT